MRQIRGGAKDMPPVKDLIFKDAYVNAGRTMVLSDGSVNYVVELYDTALKETISKLKNAERLVRVKDKARNCKTSEFKAVIEKAEAEQSRLLAQKKAQEAKFTGKFGELKGKFKTAGEKIRRLAVPLVEGSTVPPVLPSSDPGSPPLGASSIVDEEAPARELSDSSTERSGQNKSSDGAPPGVREDLNASSVERGERGSEDAIAQVPEEPESRSLVADPPISDAGVVENVLDPVPRLSVDDPGRGEG
ncbi:hypothetical protein F2Q70_00015688 [Brassica cretica]|uniref:Uncharacterized protein n=1 Tax=Brassica cretica TaxID=69181 RepID=A0A8S9HUX1_BRACR|nr:hypothetical protein F2Q70_00015688 [Brassica cretica]